MTRTITLAGGGHKYVLRYSSGGERAAVDELIRLARTTGTGVGWLDAARLSHQIAQSLLAADPGLGADLAARRGP